MVTTARTVRVNYDLFMNTDFSHDLAHCLLAITHYPLPITHSANGQYGKYNSEHFVDAISFFVRVFMSDSEFHFIICSVDITVDVNIGSIMGTAIRHCQRGPILHHGLLCRHHR